MVGVAWRLTAISRRRRRKRFNSPSFQADRTQVRDFNPSIRIENQTAFVFPVSVHKASKLKRTSAREPLAACNPTVLNSTTDQRYEQVQQLFNEDRMQISVIPDFLRHRHRSNIGQEPASKVRAERKMEEQNSP
jgi:hypothetical protein